MSYFSLDHPEQCAAWQIQKDIKLVELHLHIHLFNHLEQVQKSHAQSPATAVRNILVHVAGSFLVYPETNFGLHKLLIKILINCAFLKNAAFSLKSSRFSKNPYAMLC
jgi:hypothetical protein